MTDATEAVLQRPAADSLDLRRWYPVPQALMWRLWTDPVHMARWWGPEGMTCPDCAVDLRVGGAWTTTIVGQSGAENRTSCRYVEVDPPRKLVSTWAWIGEDGPGHESQLTIEIEPEGDGCRLRLLHERLLPDQVESHSKGWMSSFAALAAHIAAEPGPAAGAGD